MPTAPATSTVTSFGPRNTTTEINGPYFQKAIYDMFLQSDKD